MKLTEKDIGRKFIDQTGDVWTLKSIDRTRKRDPYEFVNSRFTPNGLWFYEDGLRCNVTTSCGTNPILIPLTDLAKELYED